MATRRNAADEVVFSGFTRDDFSSGRFGSGRATIRNPRFRYREVTAKESGSKFTVVEFLADLEAADGMHEGIRWQVCGSDADGVPYAAIRAEAKAGAEETEQGFALSGRTPGQSFKPRNTSEFGELINSAFDQGFPEGNLAAPADIRALDGLDAEFTEKKRDAKDKYPPLVVTEVYDYEGKKGGGSGKAAAGQKAAVASSKSSGKPTAAQDEDAPDVSDMNAKKAATTLIKWAAAGMPDGEITTGELVRKTRKMLAELDDDKLRKDVMEYFGDEEYLGSVFEYDKKTRTVTV